MKPTADTHMASPRTEDDRTGSELVVFLGAGASTAGGYRTFLTFPHLFWPTSTEPAELKVTDKERVLLSSIRKELERKRMPLTLDSYLEILRNYNLVLQNIFSDEELRSRFSESLSFFSRVHELNQLVQRARTHICELTVTHYERVPSQQYLSRLRTFYHALYSEYQHVKVFTTNYDLVPEYFFSSEDCRPAETEFFNGFDGFTSVENARNAANQGNPLTWSTNSYDRHPHGATTFSVFRLHGCVAWYYERNPDVEPLYPQTENAIRLDLREPHTIRDYFDRLCVLYPGRSEYLGRCPHSYAFERLYDTCISGDRILFIGFAFRDADVASIVFNAIRQRCRARREGPPRFTLVIVDPYIDRDQFRFRLRMLQKMIGIPMQLTDLNIRPIRSAFPPGDDKQIQSVLEALRT